MRLATMLEDRDLGVLLGLSTLLLGVVSRSYEGVLENAGWFLVVRAVGGRQSAVGWVAVLRSCVPVRSRSHAGLQALSCALVLLQATKHACRALWLCWTASSSGM